MSDTQTHPHETRDPGADGPLSADHYRRQLEAVASNATLALFIMDEHQQCTFMNPAAERLTGFRLDEVRGRPLHYYVHHTRPDGTPYPLEECPIDQAFPQNMREQGEEVFVHKDGHFYHVAFTASPILEDGRPVGTIIEVRDITAEKAAEEERQRLMRELEMERARLATVFQQAPALIVVLRGPDHVYEMANAPYLRLVGPRELIGRPVREALPEVVEQGFITLLDQVYQTGRPYVGNETPVWLQSPTTGEPEHHFFDFVYQPLTTDAGEVTGILGLGIDVTERVRARTEAEEANRVKGEFLAAMSHELRTPLNAIGGYTELLGLEIHGPLTEAQRVALDRIHTNQRHLLALIQDILAFTKLEAGRVEMEVAALRANEVLRELEPVVAPQAAAKQIAFSVEECDPGLHLLGDPERVRQILLNLVSNAIKFTPPHGGVSVLCDVEPERVRIRVRDTGPGIPPEKHEAIFEPFVQIDRRLDRPQEGIGLGLAISRELARAMGGELEVQSEPGQGSTFTLTLPRAEAPAGS